MTSEVSFDDHSLEKPTFAQCQMRLDDSDSTRSALVWQQQSNSSNLPAEDLASITWLSAASKSEGRRWQYRLLLVTLLWLLLMLLPAAAAGDGEMQKHKSITVKL